MTITVTSREFNQDVSRAKRAAAAAPVVITDRGRPAYVLMSYEEFERTGRLSDADAGTEDALRRLSMDDVDFFDFDPPRLELGLRAPDL